MQTGAYKYLSGTSMAVPHVTGAIARVWAVYPNCPANIVRAAFEQTAKDLGPRGKDVRFGNGLVQAEAAFDYLARQPCAKGPAVGALDADERTQLGQ
jgi:subtilisin family serine protease